MVVLKGVRADGTDDGAEHGAYNSTTHLMANEAASGTADDGRTKASLTVGADLAIIILAGGIVGSSVRAGSAVVGIVWAVSITFRLRRVRLSRGVVLSSRILRDLGIRRRLLRGILVVWMVALVVWCLLRRLVVVTLLAGGVVSIGHFKCNRGRPLR